METSLEIAKPIMLRPLVKPDEMIEAQAEITQLIVKALKRGTDYGLIPGAKKDVLFKPGSERIQKAFGCHTVFEIIEKEIDHNAEVKWVKMQWNNNSRRKEEFHGTSLGLYRYVIKAIVIGPHGAPVGSGMGSCSTMELKYVDRPRDLENTVLKMAQKRAKVAATLDAFALSDRFTQDLEDDKMPEQTHEQTYEAPEEQHGYNPQNREHNDALDAQLKKRKVPEEDWGRIKVALKGKSITELPNILGAQ